jgi:hypothetical protein
MCSSFAAIRTVNAELDISGLPDNVTFGDLKPGMLAAPSAIIAGPKSAVMAAP